MTLSDGLSKIGDFFGLGGSATLIGYILGGLRNGLNRADKALITSLQTTIDMQTEEIARLHKIKRAEDDEAIDRIESKLDKIYEAIKTETPQIEQPAAQVPAVV